MNKLKFEVSTDNYEKFRVVANKIESLLYKLDDDTKFHSNPKFILEHENYLELVKMGKKIVPYLFKLGVEHGWSWSMLHLLHDITGENPTTPEHNGRYMHVVLDWIGWYLKSEYYVENDVYYNLID